MKVPYRQTEIPTLVRIDVADPPEGWGDLGFTVTDSSLNLGGVRVAFGVAGHGITSWEIDGIPEGTRAIDGLATTPVRSHLQQTGGTHPNGAVGIDQVVITTPDFDRTAIALEQNAMPLKRIRDAGTFRQGFRRLGPAILELVEVPNAPPGPATFWGLAVIVSDLDALASRLGDRLAAAKPAVQPGRRIATLRDTAGLSTKLAFMDPEGP